MAKSTTTIPATGLVLNRVSSRPLSAQIAELLRQQILSGQIHPGACLPSTRTLARELGVSRTTALLAYDQLVSEGYLAGQIGAGTTVASVLPDTLLTAPAPSSPSSRRPPEERTRRISKRAIALTSAGALPIPGGDYRAWLQPFRSGVEGRDAFPYALWTRLIVRRARRSLPDLMAYQHAIGYLPLREAIAAYLGAARGVRCTADQVIVVSGSQGGLDLAARVLLDPGDPVWIEDPGYPGARNALTAAGARLIPVPVDADGFDPALAESRCPAAQLVYVTPSHQFPLGATMSLPRRLALLDYAARTGGWIVEDDYDGEFRYRGRPLPALQGLQPNSPVIYIGTFSKVLFPALRLGYLVAPPDLVDAFVAARRVVDTHPPALEQAVLTDFIADGHFGRHIRRMRTLYAARAEALVAAAHRDLTGLLDLLPPTAGLGTVGWLPPGVDDGLAARHAAAHDVFVAPVSAFALEPLPRGGLLLGFAPVDEAAIVQGVRRLADALRSLH